MPEILKNIKLIIIENDFETLEHKKYVDNELKKNNFILVYKQPLKKNISWYCPCKENFYETWKKSDN